MNIQQKTVNARGIKLYIEAEGREIARASLFILKNDFRGREFGYMEDVFVDEKYRGQGLAKELIKKIIELAKANRCYKIVGLSRYGRENVHNLYKKMGFTDFGVEFKMYLENFN